MNPYHAFADQVNRLSVKTVYIIAGVLILAFLLVIGFIISGMSEDSSSGSSSKSKKGMFTATGLVTTKTGKYGDCSLDGDQVVIMDAEGKDLAFGSLTEGDVDADIKNCTHVFMISDVKSGEDVYKMTIGNKQAPRATEEELTTGISLKFG